MMSSMEFQSASQQNRKTRKNATKQQKRSEREQSNPQKALQRNKQTQYNNAKLRNVVKAPKALEVAKKSNKVESKNIEALYSCLLYTSPSPRDGLLSRMPSSA